MSQNQSLSFPRRNICLKNQSLSFPLLSLGLENENPSKTDSEGNTKNGSQDSKTITECANEIGSHENLGKNIVYDSKKGKTENSLYLLQKAPDQPLNSRNGHYTNTDESLINIVNENDDESKNSENIENNNNPAKFINIANTETDENENSNNVFELTDTNENNKTNESKTKETNESEDPTEDRANTETDDENEKETPKMDLGRNAKIIGHES